MPVETQHYGAALAHEVAWARAVCFPVNAPLGERCPVIFVTITLAAVGRVGRHSNGQY